MSKGMSVYRNQLRCQLASAGHRMENSGLTVAKYTRKRGAAESMKHIFKRNTKEKGEKYYGIDKLSRMQ